MKISDTIQKLLKKSGSSKNNRYLQSAYQAKSAPLQQESYGQQKNKVVRVKQWLVTRKSGGYQEYKPPKKKNSRWLWRGVLAGAFLGLTVFLIFGGGRKIQNGFESIQMFQVSDLEITGNGIVSDGILREATGIIIHQTSMLGINASKIEGKLAAVPWIATVKVRKNWPSAVEIAVKENIPLALLHNRNTEGSELFYIDKNGISFLPVRPGGELDLPVVTGLSEVTDETVKEQALNEVLVFLKKVRRNDPHLPAQSLSEVHVSPTGELVVYLVEYPFPIFFGSGNTKQKYARLVQVLKALYKKEKGEELISEIEYIQMDYLQNKVLVAQTGSG
jgi:cell division septal protein FtsQ